MIFSEIFSNSDNQGNTRSVKNNIFLYLLIIISALILIYIIYSLNNINDLKKKILIIEKSLSTISSLNYDEKINSFTKINKAQNEIINKNTLKINEITAINDNINDIINNIELDKSRIDLKQPTNTSSVLHPNFRPMLRPIF